MAGLVPAFTPDKRSRFSDELNIGQQATAIIADGAESHSMQVCCVHSEPAAAGDATAADGVVPAADGDDGSAAVAGAPELARAENSQCSEALSGGQQTTAIVCSEVLTAVAGAPACAESSQRSEALSGGQHIGFGGPPCGGKDSFDALLLQSTLPRDSNSEALSSGQHATATVCSKVLTAAHPADGQDAAAHLLDSDALAACAYERIQHRMAERIAAMEAQEKRVAAL